MPHVPWNPVLTSKLHPPVRSLWPRPLEAIAPAFPGSAPPWPRREAPSGWTSARRASEPGHWMSWMSWMSWMEVQLGMMVRGFMGK